jgi:glycosyltransferase involved in cell wall biosynthesis
VASVTGQYGSTTSTRSVPLVAPGRGQLLAGALWVVLANWAEAIERRYGSAPVVTPDRVLSPAEARALAFSPAATTTVARRKRRGRAVETLAKDVRALWRGARYSARVDVPSVMNPVYVWQHHDLFQRAGIRLARRLDVPLLLFVHAPQVWEARQWGVGRPGWGRLVERLGERPQFRSADIVACVSEEVAAAAVDLGADPRRVMIAPCTADGDRFDTVSSRRADLGLRDDVIVGWIGTFRPFHNVDLLIRAVAESRRACPRLALLLVGDGPTRSACETLARELDVPSTFIGTVVQDDVPALLKTFDIAAIPSGSDGGFHYSPLKLKEYLAAGRATVVPSVGEMARLLVDRRDTVLYQPGAEGGLRDAISELARNEPLRESIATAGRARFEECFTIDRQLDEVEERLGIT